MNEIMVNMMVAKMRSAFLYSMYRWHSEQGYAMFSYGAGSVFFLENE